MRRRDGFTLIEVLVALVVGSLVLLGARRVLEALAEEAHDVTARAAEADRNANRERELRALVEQLEVGAPGTVPFAGNPESVRFSSWCEVPAGGSIAAP